MYFDRYEICCGVHANIMNTDKFKRNFVSVNFVLPHKKEYAALSSLLGDVLTRASRKYPELKLVERELDECYGAQLSAYATVKGETKIITVSMESLCECYAMDGMSIFSRSSDMLCEIIFDPYMDSGVFAESIVESEREKLLASVRRRKNSKRNYALDKLKEHMCKNEAYGIPSYGSEEDIISITPLALTEFYKKMLSEAAIELFYVGDETRERVVSLFSDMFENMPRSIYDVEKYPATVGACESKFFFEEADYKQSVLTMGYRIDLGQNKRMKYAFSLFNALFGSGVNSKLFKVVREQMHLCYYASCVPDLCKGIAFVSSGIDYKNEDVTKNAIIEQYNAVKDGNFTDEDVADCKRSIENAYKELYDSPEGLCTWYLSHVMFGDFESIESVSQNICSITRDEILQAADCMTLDCVFVLRGTSKISSEYEEVSDL